jgi:hypothetical protein
MEREDVKVCEKSPRSVKGNVNASTSPISGGATDAASFSPSVFPAVSDMVPYPASPPGGEAKVQARLEEGPVELRTGLAVCSVPCRMSPSLGSVLRFGTLTRTRMLGA